MTVADARAARPINWWKTGFFLLLFAMGLVVVYVDETFVFHPQDPEWAHIAPFRWLLLVHASFAIPALILGPLQFSERIRTRAPQIHRTIGWIYVSALLVAAPIAIYIGVNYEQPLTAREQWFQGGGWLLCTLLGFIAGYNRNFAQHRTWMARSYAFCFIFIASRVTDAFPGLIDSADDRQLSTQLWVLVVLALIIPDLLMNGADIFKSRRPKRQPVPRPAA
ncbi:MAG TPA: DUF2306 domain-containing protein [Rhizomicrobium sp.]|nr:DUF2306 domain-containing protein [Rhizomicrobium sp.]